MSDDDDLEACWRDIRGRIKQSFFEDSALYGCFELGLFTSVGEVVGDGYKRMPCSCRRTSLSSTIMISEVKWPTAQSDWGAINSIVFFGAQGVPLFQMAVREAIVMAGDGYTFLSGSFRYVNCRL